MTAGPLFDRSIIVTAVIYGLLLRAALFAGLFGLLLLILLLLSLARYGYALLLDVAHQRRLRPPGIDTLGWSGGRDFVLHALLYYSASYFLLSTGLLGGPLWSVLRWLAFAVLLAGFPASAAQLAVSRDLGAALQPARVIAFARAMGERYLGLLGACAALFALLLLSRTVLARAGLPWLLLADCLGIWVYLCLFMLTGAALGERRAAFGLQAEPDLRQDAQRRQREQQRLWYLDRAYVCLRGGNLTPGYDALNGLIEAEGRSLEIYQWLFDRLLTWDDSSHALAVAERYIDRLIESGRHGSALDLLQRCRRIAPQFRPTPDALAALLAFARDHGWHRIADELQVRDRGAQSP